MIKDIEDWIVKNLNQIEDGDIDSVPFFLDLKRLENLIKDSKNQLSEYVLDDLSGSVKEIDGYKIEPQKGRKMWNFKHLPQWNYAKNQLSTIEHQAKLAYENTIIDENTGEVVEAAIVTYSKDTIKVSKSK